MCVCECVRSNTYDGGGSAWVSWDEEQHSTLYPKQMSWLQTVCWKEKAEVAHAGNSLQALKNGSPRGEAGLWSVVSMGGL
eukprot:1145008-Pelagomonas_calceolata.AAC.5